jgi:hypothetical protein
MKLTRSPLVSRQARGAFKMRPSGMRIESPATGRSSMAPFGIISPAHGRFVGAVDEVHAALAEDLPDLVAARQFSG